MLGRRIDREDVCVGEPIEEGEGARTRTAAQVNDVVRGLVQRQPGDDGSGVIGEDLGIQSRISA